MSLYALGPGYVSKAQEKAQKQCVNCGRQFSVTKPSQLARRQFCSTSCMYTYRRTHPPLKPCVVCGRIPEARHATRKTCSAQCGYEYRKRRTRNPSKCRQCGKSFWPVMRKSGLHSRFCSLACVHAHRSIRHAFVESICANCGITFRRTKAALERVDRTFCSRECGWRFMRGENSPMYRGDKDPNRGAKWNALAESIRIRDGYKCQRCNKTQEENGQKLSVDHMRPWRSFEDKADANDPSNLISLCRSCHSTKTGVYERAWLRGDCIGMYQYEHNMKQPSAVREHKP